MNPKVSVLMPVFNAAPYVRQAVESILNQSWHDFELIIINDASTDGTDRVLAQLNDPRIRLVNNPENLGIIASRNKAIAHARGHYIANMDADDISMPDRLRRQVEYMDAHPEVAVLACRLTLINSHGEPTGDWPEDVQCITPEQIAATLPVINCIGQPTVMMRGSVMRRIGYNKNYLHNEDWGLWLDVLADGYLIHKLPEVMLKYRVHSASTTVNSNAAGVNRKIIRFKSAYVINRVRAGVFRGSDYRVLGSLARHIMRRMVPDRVLHMRNVFREKMQRIRPVGVLKQGLKLLRLLARRKIPLRQIFFFPFYHTGGAENVHNSILETVADQRPLVLITSQSAGTAWKSSFEKSGDVVEIFHLLQFGPAKRWLTGRLVGLCERERDMRVFGCNARFFYELIPLLPEHVKPIDLVHAFVHEHEDGPEKWSLTVVPRLFRRVVINRRTAHDFSELYKKHGVPDYFADRITCIPNFVPVQKAVKRSSAGELGVIYVGRGSEEKRVHLIARVAARAGAKGLPVRFTFVGDVRQSIPDEYLPYCTLAGEVTDPARMHTLYRNSHMLALVSSREGFPMVIMEAMMNGTVPVATAVGGIPEHVHHMENGVLIPAEGEDEIVHRLLETIEYFCRNRKELEALSDHAHAYALRHFNREFFFDTYRKLLTDEHA